MTSPEPPAASPIARLTNTIRCRARNGWIIAALALAGPPCLPAGAAELAVDPAIPSAYQTITAALAACADGDVIKVAAGVYSATAGETFPLRVDKAVAVEAAAAGSPPTVTVQGDGQNSVFLVSRSGAALRGLRITGGLGSEGVYAMDGGGVCVFVGADATGQVTIDRCVIDGNSCRYDATYDGCGGGVYVGGTFCTCFCTVITGCEIRDNVVKGNGAGVYGAIISNTVIEDTLVEDNTADDRGGGICIDTYATMQMARCQVLANVAAGDTRNNRVDWGGKGGGVYLAERVEAVCLDSTIADNHAKYFGGGIFTAANGSVAARTGLPTNYLQDCVVAGNRADATGQPAGTWQPSGGGAYVRQGAFLRCTQGTTFHRNDAQQDGGGVLVVGNGVTGGTLVTESGCLLEGNEGTRDGGAIWLGSAARADLRATRLLGNTAGRNGGALCAEAGARLAVDDCLITYNNAARGTGAAFHLGAADASISHATIAGNFAPWGRSAIARTGGTCSVIDSILWRNAGGSVAPAPAGLTASHSLIEDADVAGANVIHADPRFGGWGPKTVVHVDQAAPAGGDGTPGAPYQDLQRALDGFDFAPGAGSPCRGAASDGTGDMGAAAGSAGTPGNVTAGLLLAAGDHDIRGRNLMMTRGVDGAGAQATRILHTVFGHVEDTHFRDLAIAGDAWFGVVTLRANALFERCTIGPAACLYDGGGAYVAAGTCTLRDSDAAQNTCSGRGGGLWVGPACGLVAEAGSTILDNRSGGHGGGAFLDADAWIRVTDGSRVGANKNTGALTLGGGICALNAASVTVADSTIDLNSSTGDGGGIRADCQVDLTASLVANNTSVAACGGGVWSSGNLAATRCRFAANSANAGYQDGGGLLVDDGTALLTTCEFEANVARDRGGAAYVRAGTDSFRAVQQCRFRSNRSSQKGGAVGMVGPIAVLEFDDCAFESNTANQGGGVYIDVVSPRFKSCVFAANSVTGSLAAGGALFALAGSVPLCEDCTFTSNTSQADGGALGLENTTAVFSRCGFEGSTAAANGGMATLRGNDRSRFLTCTNDASRAGGNGGGLHVDGSSAPLVHDCAFTANTSDHDGGAVFCRGTTAAQFHDSRFEGCGALNYGGACRGEASATLLFARCRFTGNSVTDATESADGGALFVTDDVDATINCCRFEDNFADDNGGAISVQGRADLVMANALVARNRAKTDGGGLHWAGSATVCQLRNCTLWANTVDRPGAGGVYVGADCAATLDSCILYQNVTVEFSGPGVPAVANSCVAGGHPGSGNLTGDPLLSAPDATLAAGSPCIDAGNPDPARNDAARPPGQGGERNDIGWTGGPSNACPGFVSSGATLVGPLALCAAAGQASEPVVGSITIPGLTGARGGLPRVEAEFGSGAAGTDPASWTSWVAGTYQRENGESDEYSATMPAPAAGVIRYLWRFRFMGGAWIYADADGSGNGWAPEQLGELRGGDLVFGDMAAPADMVLVGGCVTEEGVLRLTRDLLSQVGAAWYRFRVPVDDADGFDTVFSFRINHDGGDGLAFVLQDTGTSAIGASGAAQGYNIARSLAVEFDTLYHSTDGDPNGNHLSIQSAGTGTTSRNHPSWSLGESPAIPNLSDNAPHLARIRYRNHRLQVFVDDLRAPAVEAQVDLSAKLGLKAGWLWAGFTAGTGGGANHETHDLLGWTFAHAAVALPDTDADGLPDWWERLHFGADTAAAPAADPDGDGQTNAAEFAADTDPNSPASLLRLSIRQEAAGLLLEWQAGRGVVQVLEACARPGDPWTPLATFQPPTLPRISFPAAPDPSGRRFYRLRVIAP